MNDNHNVKAIGHRVLKVVAVTALIAGVSGCMIGKALAHDHWISRGEYRDPVHNWSCCGDNDCHPMKPGDIKTGPEGMSLPTGEVLPYNRLLTSEDEDAWICRWNQTDIVRCIFLPPNGS